MFAKATKPKGNGDAWKIVACETNTMSIVREGD